MKDDITHPCFPVVLDDCRHVQARHQPARAPIARVAADQGVVPDGRHLRQHGLTRHRQAAQRQVPFWWT